MEKLIDDRANEQKKQLLARIQGYHKHISQNTHEMTKIYEHRALSKSKQEMIRKKEQKS